MAYRAFGVRLVFLVAFPFLVVLIQFLAVSRLNTPGQYPWQVEGGWEGEEVRRAEKRLAQPTHLEHVS